MQTCKITINMGTDICIICYIYNFPTRLFPFQILNYGMGSISAIHGITLSAWGFAGLTGNQLANWIVEHFGEPKTIMSHGEQIVVNPTGYQYVLYATIALYIVAMFQDVHQH